MSEEIKESTDNGFTEDDENIAFKSNNKLN